MAIQNQRIPILVSLLWHSRTVTPAACLFRKSISLCGKYIIIFYVKKKLVKSYFSLFWRGTFFLNVEDSAGTQLSYTKKTKFMILQVF